MNLPHLDNPELYQGLYVFDFGERVAVGYTGEEIEVLLGSAEFEGGRAFKIHHASADGQLSMRGVSRMDVGVREGIIFYRRSAEAARADYEADASLTLQTAIHTQGSSPSSLASRTRT